MGRIKELCIDLMNTNNGILPEEATIADITRMKELEISNWQEYERYRQREKSLKSPSEKIINNKTINNEEGD